MSVPTSAGDSKFCAARLTTPVLASTVNRSASSPSRLQVTAPMAPVRLGVALVYAAFSATLLSDRLPIVSVAVSATSVTVTATAWVAVLPSASVALSV